MVVEQEVILKFGPLVHLADCRVPSWANTAIRKAEIPDLKFAVHQVSGPPFKGHYMRTVRMVMSIFLSKFYICFYRTVQNLRGTSDL